MRKMGKTSHFKINYQYREYHFTKRQIQHSAPNNPNKTPFNLYRIHKSAQMLGLILTFHISYSMSSRKTASIIRNVFKEEISYQTVLNYSKAVAYYAHKFNLNHKGPIANILVADETYIKVKGIQNYVWFLLSGKNRIIAAYHISDNRGTASATAALKEAIRTAEDGQKLTIVTDGLGSYTEAIHLLNKERKERQLDNIDHIQVIGLQNKDEVSAAYRPFKQIIERFNRTYKRHVKPAAGFSSFNGAMALTTLFVTHYNFLRPNSANDGKPPVHIEQLTGIDTIQAKWVKLIDMMIDL